MENELDKAKIELINLYLNIKVRSQEEVNSLTEENLILETDNIMNLSILDIIEYIKSTIDIIISIKVESKINDYKIKEDNNAAKDYETLLQKLESSIRQHIAYEHQLKIEYEKSLIKSEEKEIENNELLYKIKNIEKENKILRNNENNLKEQLEMKEKELIEAQIKLKELKAMKIINNNNFDYNTNNNNNYRTKSYISKSNSSINIYKDNMSEKKDNIINNTSILNNNKNIKYKKIKKSKITNNNISLNTLTLMNTNKYKKKYNNNNLNKKYINNLTTILFIKEPKIYKKKERNISLNKNRNTNKSMLDLFPSRNFNKKYNNNSNKKKKNKSLNITHNTINMNKNNVLINLNANIINTKTPIEKYQIQQKLNEYKKYINKKLNEYNKKSNKKNIVIQPPSNKNYKKINKYFNKSKLATCVQNIK